MCFKLELSLVALDLEANPAINTSFVTGLASSIHWLDVEAACTEVEAAVHN